MSKSNPPLFAEALQLVDDDAPSGAVAWLFVAAVLAGAVVAVAIYRLLAWHWGLCV